MTTETKPRKPRKTAAQRQAEKDQRMGKTIDAFVNAVTGAGYASDKFSYLRFMENEEIDDVTLEALYTSNDLAATIVERVVHDALRSGYTLNWQGGSDQEKRDVKDWAEQEYTVTNQTKRARIYSRLFGGGGVLLGGGPLQKQLVPGDRVEFLRAIPGTELYARPIDGYYANPALQNFGEVAYYEYNTPLFHVPSTNGQQEYSREAVHESKVIPFYGVLSTDTEKWSRDRGWGKSVLHRVYAILKKFESSFDSVLHTLAEQSVIVSHAVVVGA